LIHSVFEETHAELDSFLTKTTSSSSQKNN